MNKYNEDIKNKNPKSYHLLRKIRYCVKFESNETLLLTAIEVFNQMLEDFLEEVLYEHAEYDNKDKFLFSFEQTHEDLYFVYVYDRPLTFENYEKNYEKQYQKELYNHNKNLKRKEKKKVDEIKLYERLKKKFEKDENE